MKFSIEGTLVLDTNMALKKLKLVLRADPFNEKVFTHSTGFFQNFYSHQNANAQIIFDPKQ